MAQEVGTINEWYQEAVNPTVLQAANTLASTEERRGFIYESGLLTLAGYCVAYSVQSIMSLITFTLFTLLLAAASAHGAVYIWKDTAGVTHYTNNQDEIPVRYRLKAKVLYPDQVDAGSMKQNVPVQQQKPEEPLPATAPQPAADTRQPAPVVTTPPPVKPAVSPAKRERKRRGEPPEE